jgi:hypothetical protein
MFELLDESYFHGHDTAQQVSCDFNVEGNALLKVQVYRAVE